jgi:hypothetical protein
MIYYNYHRIKSKVKTTTLVSTVPKSNIKIIEKGNIDTPKAHCCSLSWRGTGTSIKVTGLN